MKTTLNFNIISVMNKFLSIFSILSTVIQFSYAQTEVWPVQITGFMLPPHSLDLKVYGIDRPDDINFQVLLNDPDELSLQVIPVVTVEQNGNVIYRTDMNASIQPIVLNQFVAYNIGGEALDQYLANDALTGNNGIGRGSTMVPEGFTQICLQMYGVDRVVPVSNKFCISANFRLNQSPQLIKPAFNEKIKMPPVQNMIFSWMPMHLNSGNNPGPVEYLFELVELPLGVMNANDAFESALKIYSTTVMSTSFIYSPSEPILNANTYYAWRVKVNSISYATSKLFQNDGKSEISMFLMYDGDAPSTELNPFNKPAPQGCSVYETSYGSVKKSDNFPTILAPNQDVEVGYFTMKITESSGDPSIGYSGKGLIEFPMLKSLIEVRFNNIKVNKEGRVYEAERIQSIVDAKLYIDVENITKEKLKLILNEDYLINLSKELSKPNKIINQFAEGSVQKSSLPLQLKSGNENPGISIVGIEFTTTNAYLNIISQVNEGAVFAGTLIPASPYGIKSNAHLSLINSKGLSETRNKLLESIESGISYTENSKMTWDCHGYLDVNKHNQLNVSQDILRGTGDSEAVSFETISKQSIINNSITEVRNFPPFSINGLSDFEFVSEKGILDLSDQISEELKDLAVYDEATVNSWKGLHLQNVKATAPPKYNFIDGRSPIIFENGDILINDHELAYSHFIKTDVLSLKNGTMGPWKYSIDTMKLAIKKKEVTDLMIHGKIKTPFFTEQFPYKAVVKSSSTGQVKLDAQVPETDLEMDMWHGNFQVLSGSNVKGLWIEQEESRQLIPSGKFNGMLRLNFSDKQFKDAILNENKGTTIDELKKALKLESLSFDLKELKIDGLIADPFKVRKEQYKIEKLDAKKTNLVFGNSNNALSGASFLYESEHEQERLGLKLIVVKGQSKVELIVWSKAKSGDFEFEGIEIKTIDLKCNCTVLNVLPTKDEWERIIEDYYEKTLSLRDQTTITKGGIMNSDGDHANPLLKQVEKSMIKQQSISWFPASMDQSVIYIPFLNKYLNIEKEGEVYKGKYKHPMFGKTNIPWNELTFNNLENNSGDTLSLPLIITDDLWSQFGFKGAYTLPYNFVLYISEFKSGANKLENATIKLHLVGKLEVDGLIKFIEFSTLKEIAIGPDKVALKDVQMHLLYDTKLNNNVSYLATIKDGAGESTADAGSFASLSCEDGLSRFNLQGHLTSSLNTIVTEVNKKPQPAVFGFRLIEDQIDNNVSLLTDFIAPLKSTNRIEEEWMTWKFTTIDDPHVIFSPGKSLEAYLDFSPVRSESTSTHPNSRMDEFHTEWMNSGGFTGILFKQLQFDVPVLEMNRLNETATPEPFNDTIYNAYYDLSGAAFFASYQGLNKVTKTNNARLGGWRYYLDTISMKIEYSALDENKLALKGSVKLPLFKEAPEKDKEKWLEDYNDSWVGFKIGIEYNRQDKVPSISGFVNNINTSVFESAHIDGLGIKLEEESNVEFYYERQSQKLKARTQLHGRGIYTIKKLDAKIPVFKFESLRLNYSVSGLCKGDGMDGIESIDFGTWGISPFSNQDTFLMKKLARSSSGQKLKDKAKGTNIGKGVEEKFDGLSKLAGFEINIHQPKFTCTGSEYKLIVGLDLSITRDKQHLTDAQKVEYDQFHPLETAQSKNTESQAALKPIEEEYRKAQENIKSVANEKKALLEEIYQNKKAAKKFAKKIDRYTEAGKKEKASEIFNSKELTVIIDKHVELNKKLEAVNNKFTTSLQNVKDKYKPFKQQNATVKAAQNEVDAQTKAAIAKNDKNKTLKGRAENFKEDFKSKLDEAKKTKTGAFSAGGDIEISFTNKGFKDVALTCLALGGEFGPLSFKGGLNLFRDETNASNFDPNAAQSEWGNGFLGMIELGVLNYEFKTKFQTGVKFDKPDATADVEDFRYFFVDLSFNGNPGLPLDNAGQFSLTGVGGGFYFNMETVKPKFEDVKKESSPEASKDNKKESPQKVNNDHCQVAGLKAGESLSGMQYQVSKGSFGGYLMAEISHKASVSLENIVSVEMSVIKGEFKFKQFGIAVNGFALYTDYKSRKKSNAVEIRGDLTVNFEKDIKAYGGVRFRFGKKAGPIDIAAPVDKNTNANSWNEIKFLFSKDANYVHAGSWGIPEFLPFYRSDVKPYSKLNFLSAGFDAPLIGKVMAGLYFQGGTQIDGFPTVKTFMPNYRGKIMPNATDVSPTGTTSGANAGFILYAKMEGGFALITYKADGMLGANLTVSKILKSNSCNEDGSSIGFSNGYYARGNVFASLNADVNLEVNIPFVYSGKYNILKSKMDFVMDFGFPNPGYLQGEFSFHYSILGGLKEGDETIDFDAGNKPCIVRTPNPTIGLIIHKDLNPKDGSTDIKYLDTIKVETRLPYLKPYCIDSQSTFAGFFKLPNKYVRYRIKSFILREKEGGRIVKTEQVLRELESNYQVVILEKLKPETTYEIEYLYVWEKSIDNQLSYTDLPGSDEKGRSEFTTAEADAVITHDMLEYAIPGHHQRYWNNKYAIPCLKFKANVSNEKIGKIFPNDQLYLYFAIIKEYKTDGSIVIHKIPIENIPTSDNQQDRFETGVVDEHNSSSNQRERYQTAFYGNYFHLWKGNWLKDLGSEVGTVAREQGYLSYLNLNKLPLSKGSLCNMVVYRAIPKDKSPSDLNALLAQYSEEESKYQIPIYHNSFGVSQYASLKDKMNDISVSFGATDLSITESKRVLGNKDNPGIVSDSYWGFTQDDIQAVVDRSIADSLNLIPRNAYLGINGTKEGIDLFDLDYLRRFSDVYATGELNFSKWNSFKYDNGQNLHMIDNTYYELDGENIPDYEYLKDSYAYVSEGNLLNKSSVFFGRFFDFKLFSNRAEVNKYEITHAEIQSGKLQSVSLGKNYESGFIYDENSDFDFIIEDGFQSTRALQFLLIKNYLDHKGYEVFYNWPDEPDHPIWINNKYTQNPEFKITWNGESRQFNWKDYHTGDLQIFIDSDRTALPFDGYWLGGRIYNSPEVKNNLLPLKVNRENLK